jgi:hypothetical protein
MANHRTSLTGDLLRGAIAGGVATWAMDQVTTALLDQASQADKEQEKAAQPRGKSSARNLTDRLAQVVAPDATEQQRDQAATAIHWGLGIVPGALYGALRNRVPFVGAGRGLVYGTLLFLGNDEYLNTELGLAAEPSAYPASTHARGLVGHLVLGAATDTVFDVLGG